MRFRMTFETEDSGKRRYMGTVTGISDLDPVRWKNSQWRNLQVGWDESTAGEKRNRVSLWEIEPVTAPFFICPTTPFFRSKRPRQPGMPDEDPSDLDNLMRRSMPWIGDDYGLKDPQAMPGLSLVQWMNMQQNASLANSMQQPNYLNPLSGSVLQNLSSGDLSRQLALQQNNLQFNAQRPAQPVQQLDQLQKLSASTLNPLDSVIQPQQQMTDLTQPPHQNLINQTLPTSQAQAQLLHMQNSTTTTQAPNVIQQSLVNHQIQRNLPQNLNQPQNFMSTQTSDHMGQQLQVPENQIQLQLLQKFHQQQQSLLAQQSSIQQPSQLAQFQDQQKQLLDTSQSFPRSMSTSQMLDASQATSTSLPQSHVLPQQMTRSNGQITHPPQPLKLQHQHPGILPELPGQMGSTLNPMSNQLLAGGTGCGGHSVVTDEVPSCSTSPSTNNCVGPVQSMITGRNHRSITPGEEIAQSSAALLSSNNLETISSNGNFVKDLLQKPPDTKSSLNMSKSQNLGFFASQPYLNASANLFFSLLSNIFSFILSSNPREKMSCCGKNSGYRRSDTHPEEAVAETLVVNVAPEKTCVEGSAESKMEGGNACTCNPCNCNPCTCK